MFWTIGEAKTALATRALSPVELVAHCLKRIGSVDKELHSFVLPMPEAAMAQARAVEAAMMRGEASGALAGIPVGIKDIFDVAGVPTTCNSRSRLDHVAGTDATATRKLRQAGAIIVGKLATTEFAMGGPAPDTPFPPARNPWDTRRFSGGSSSGSAVAIATGRVVGARGRDTEGSIRQPAALCGLAGLKPSFGLVGRSGVFPLAPSLDHAGPMAWTVRDCAILLQAIAGHDSGDPGSAETRIPDYQAKLGQTIQGMRVGIPHRMFRDDKAFDPEVLAGFDAAVDALRGLGASVTEVETKPLMDYTACAVTIMLFEGYRIHERALSKPGNHIGAFLRQRMMLGAKLTQDGHDRALAQRRALIADIEAALGQCDVLALPTTKTPASLFGEWQPMAFLEQPSLTAPAALTGYPSLNVCCGFTRAGLPLAFQLIGRRFDEATLLQVGDAYERATPWRGRRPAF